MSLRIPRQIARLAVSGACVASALAAPPTYRVTPVRDKTVSMSCNALNAQGDVAGTAVTEPRANYGYDAVVVSRDHAHSYGWSHGQRAAERPTASTRAGSPSAT